jgi:hypothetical protein
VIAANFTGPSLGGLGSFLSKILRKKKMSNREETLTIDEIN